MSNGKINITVKLRTHKRLADLGSKDETFDAIIVRLLDFYDAHKEGAQ